MASKLEGTPYAQEATRVVITIEGKTETGDEKVLEGAPSKKPVVRTWFEPGSVVLKIRVENPSKDETQTFPVKIYLPKEVNPKDILDLGDLTLNFDPEMGMYFVSNDVTLEPGQSITTWVEMEDIWMFTEEKLSSLVNQAKIMASKLEGTPYAQEATRVVITIEGKVQEILKRQEETVDYPREHIRAYREGLNVISTVEENLFELDRLEKGSSGEGQGKDLSAKGSAMGSSNGSAKGSSSDSGDANSRIALGAGSDDTSEGGAPLGRSISMTTAWRIIFAILAFLAVLSIIFFMTWLRRVQGGGGTTESMQQEAPLSTGLEGAEGAEDKLGSPQSE